MPLAKKNVIFVYRSGDSDSLTVANKYRSIHDLDSDQLVSISCSNTEVLKNENDFNSEVLNPIKSAISSLTNRTVWAVVLGFNVPGGFHHGQDVIASTSRIARLNHSFDKQVRNYLYDRASFKRFDGTDANFALISTRVDAPTVAICEDMLDKTREFEKQGLANGKFYIDPYSDRFGLEATTYQNDILDFANRELKDTGLNTFSTVFLDPYIDVVLPFAEDDSFVWSWFSDRGSLSFFKNTNAARVFFYNADYDGAFTVRDVNDRRWPSLAIQEGYIATAGAMSNPGFEGLMRPRPFFKTLLEGGTLGEAFLFSATFLDWTINFFGDPLIPVVFPIGRVFI